MLGNRIAVVFDPSCDLISKGGSEVCPLGVTLRPSSDKLRRAIGARILLAMALINVCECLL